MQAFTQIHSFDPDENDIRVQETKHFTKEDRNLIWSKIRFDAGVLEKKRV